MKQRNLQSESCHNLFSTTTFLVSCSPLKLQVNHICRKVTKVDLMLINRLYSYCLFYWLKHRQQNNKYYLLLPERFHKH